MPKARIVELRDASIAINDRHCMTDSVKTNDASSKGWSSRRSIIA